MNLTNITFADKSFINQNPSIPNNNKVCDTDMNEIKSVINGNNTEIDGEMFYKPGDQISMGGNTASSLYVVNGYISESTQSVFVTSVTPKRLDNITSITINSINVEARGTSGYLNSQAGYVEYVGKSGYTITAWISSLNTITIRLKKSSAFTNVNNNTPVVLAGYFKLTLS